MSKKKPSKSKAHGKKKPAKADDTTVVLYLPANLYAIYERLRTDEKQRNLRAVYNLMGNDTTVWGMDHVLVKKKTHANTKSDHGADDGNGPKKVCDGP